MAGGIRYDLIHQGSECGVARRNDLVILAFQDRLFKITGNVEHLFLGDLILTQPIDMPLDA